MTISPDDLKHIANLAYLNDSEELDKLTLEVNSIIDFVEQLQTINTAQVEPLFHPLQLTQPLRNDEITEESCLKELATIAPLFDDALYLVPKFIESGS